MTPTVSTQPRRRRLVLVSVSVLAALLAFELVLQGIALALWLGGGEQSDPDDARPVALCIGDSFTYGLGADSPAGAYPTVAEKLCATRGVYVRFVNAGWAGQTSRDVLLRLPGQLRRHHPRVVFVLVGTNDFWERPARVDEAELGAGEPGFPLRWRTLRMARLAVDAVSRAAPAPGFVGTWHCGALPLWFADDGRGLIGGEHCRWELRDGELRVVFDRGWELPADWRLRDGRLEFRLLNWRRSFEFEPGPPGAADAPPDVGAPGSEPVATEVAAAEAVLRDHLRRIVALCRAAGAEAVLLDYPGRAFARPPAQRALRDTATELGARLVALDRQFASLRSERPNGGANLYVADGHLSSDGYLVVAASVAEQAARALGLR